MIASLSYRETPELCRPVLGRKPEFEKNDLSSSPLGYNLNEAGIHQNRKHRDFSLFSTDNARYRGTYHRLDLAENIGQNSDLPRERPYSAYYYEENLLNGNFQPDTLQIGNGRNPRVQNAMQEECHGLLPESPEGASPDLVYSSEDDLLDQCLDVFHYPTPTTDTNTTPYIRRNRSSSTNHSSPTSSTSTWDHPIEKEAGDQQADPTPPSLNGVNHDKTYSVPVGQKETTRSKHLNWLNHDEHAEYLHKVNGRPEPIEPLNWSDREVDTYGSTCFYKINKSDYDSIEQVWPLLAPSANTFHFTETMYGNNNVQFPNPENPDALHYPAVDNKISQNGVDVNNDQMTNIMFQMLSLNSTKQFKPETTMFYRHEKTLDTIKHCVFCKRNGETREYYSTHIVKDSRGKVVCPVLRKYVCPICKSSGDNAHTLRHCPIRPKMPQL